MKVVPVTNVVPHFSSFLQDAASNAIQVKDKFDVAFAGGSIINFLSQTSIKTDFIKWNVYLVDERMVPSDSPDSNYGGFILALQKMNAQVNFVPVNTGCSVDEAAIDYSKLLEGINLDLAVIGVGPDGHIASLFPGMFDPTDTLLCLPITNSPKPPSERVSMSITMLNRAMHFLFIVTGVAKKDAYQRIMANDPELPATHLHLKDSTWLVDTEIL